jgi:replication factor C subunit 2/4
MRKAITFMQTGQRLHSAQNPPTPITTESSKSCCQVPFRCVANPHHLAVFEIAGVVPGKIIDALLGAVGIDVSSGLVNNLKGKDGFQMVRDTVTMINREGYSAGQVLQQVRRSIEFESDLLHSFRSSSYMTP